MNFGQAEAGVELLTTGTVRDMDVEYRAPQDVLERVLVVNHSTPAVLHLNQKGYNLLGRLLKRHAT